MCSKSKYNKIGCEQPPMSNQNQEHNEDVDLNSSSSESILSNDSSMFFEKQCQLEEWVNHYTSGAEDNDEELEIPDWDKVSDSKKYEHICRIWLCPEEDVLDPLISICSWSGTMRFIHYECMKHWLENKLHK